MNRARLIGGLLAVILLACAVVIYLDQKNNASGGSGTVSAPANPGSVPAPTPQPSGGGGYGDLK